MLSSVASRRRASAERAAALGVEDRRLAMAYRNAGSDPSPCVRRLNAGLSGLYLIPVGPAALLASLPWALEAGTGTIGGRAPTDLCCPATGPPAGSVCPGSLSIAACAKLVSDERKGIVPEAPSLSSGA